MKGPQTPHFRDFLRELRKCMSIKDPSLRKKEIDVLVEFFLQHEKTTIEEKLYLYKMRNQTATVMAMMAMKKGGMNN